jgi:hypothetical protein
MTTELPAEVQAEVDKIETTAKKGFNLSDRLKNRGLRKASITLYLDEELGPQLGWAHDVTDALGNYVGRAREGVIGDLEIAIAVRDAAAAEHEAVQKLLGDGEKKTKFNAKELDKRIAELTAKRDELTEKLTKSGIVIHMRAVPPVIQRDTRRKAKESLGITGKNIPEEQEEDFNTAQQAHLMSVMFQTITDNETGETNAGVTYEEAIDLIGWLPEGQYLRLDQKLGTVQFTDAISRQIESQEDFS